MGETGAECVREMARCLREIGEGEGAEVRHRNQGPVPYDEIDPPIANLVRAVNEFQGLVTLSSCSGHEEEGNANEWHVGFVISGLSSASRSSNYFSAASYSSVDGLWHTNWSYTRPGIAKGATITATTRNVFNQPVYDGFDTYLSNGPLLKCAVTGK